MEMYPYTLMLPVLTYNYIALSRTDIGKNDKYSFKYLVTTE